MCKIRNLFARKGLPVQITNAKIQNNVIFIDMGL
jgi:hypothetical protein